MKVAISGKARADLLGIYQYLHTHRPAAADRFARSIDRRLAQLSQHPFIGRARAEVRKGLRNLVVGDYLVFYSVGNDVTVYRVLHSRMDIDREFRR